MGLIHPEPGDSHGELLPETKNKSDFLILEYYLQKKKKIFDDKISRIELTYHKKPDDLNKQVLILCQNKMLTEMEAYVLYSQRRSEGK